jgi:hypothetical protein
VIGVDDAVRAKLENAGVRDAEGVLALAPDKLIEIVGDRATATKVMKAARTTLGGTAPKRTAKKKTKSKKPK